MSVIQKIFAYNTGSLISGTTQVGDIAISEADVEYSANYGGLQWWGGPDEALGYVIAHSDPSRVPDYLGFWRSSGLTDSDFLTLCNSIPPRIGDTPFTNTDEAYTWLNSNGYWTSYVVSLCDSFTFNSINANTTTTSAIKTSGGGWDSSAYSVETYTNPVTLTFQTTTNGNYLMGGFSYNPTGSSETYTNITYGIYLQLNFVEIYENGVQATVLGAMTTLSTDVWKVEYNGTNVTYYKNDVLIYTSSNPVTQPLHVFFPLLTGNEGVNNVCLTEQPTVTPTPTNTPTPTGTPASTSTPTPSVTNTQTPSVTPTQGGTGNFNVTISQQGPDVVWNGSGFFNLAALSSTGPGSVSSGFNAGQAIWAIGVSAATDTYSGTSLTYPTSFGTSGVGVTSSSGSTVGILPGPPGVPRVLYVPSGYVSNTTISGGATYANNTITGMGLSAGTYTWNFTTGGNSTTLVMNIIP